MSGCRGAGSRRLGLVGVGLFLLAAEAGPAHAQAALGDVPRDLVTALLSGQGLDARVFVGEAPAEVGEHIPLPPAGQVVGGVLQGPVGTVVIAVSGTPAEGVMAFHARLEEEGWTRPSLPRDPRGGFRSNDRLGQDTWCGERYSVQAGGVRIDGTSYVRIRFQDRERGRTLCDAEAIADLRRRDPGEGLRFPDLEPPPDARVLPRGGGSTDDGIHMRAAIESELGTETLFAHYARQLLETGWVPEGQSVGADASIGRWRTEDDQGRPVTGILAIWSRSESGTHFAWASMDRLVEGR
jgi:hypothetical protein